MGARIDRIHASASRGWMIEHRDAPRREAMIQPAGGEGPT
jgi:hypothetical protein